MITTYLFSIIIWAIMIWGTKYLFVYNIKDNGWSDVIKNTRGTFMDLCLVVCIPVVRLVYFLSYVMMAGFKKETIEKLKKRFNNELD